MRLNQTREVSRSAPEVQRSGVNYDVIVIGAGLAGMFAGALAAQRGQRTLVMARGIGGTHLGTGTVDVWGPHPPAPSPVGRAQLERGSPGPEAELKKRRARKHPLGLAGLPALRAALAEFKKICAAADYPFAGDLRQNNFFLPTALGAARPTCLAPESFVAGELRREDELTLARFPGFRDFFADLAVSNLMAAGYAARAVSLDLPNFPTRRDSFSTDLARAFDEAPYRAVVADRWREPLKGVSRLGLPAILGLEEPLTAWRDLSNRLGLEIFEIPILPPSVPGMRLFNSLRRTIESAEGRVTLGPGIQGWVQADRRVGVIAETAGGPRKWSARSVILATGGFRHGGLESPAKGEVKESVFNLPVTASKQWFAPLYWDAQPYAQFGVSVNAQMQPVDAEGKVIFSNLFAIGGILAGADRLSEGSREGIDLATAWKAVEAMTNAK